MIEVSALVKRYGTTTALDGVSFSVARGQVVGFLGPNGAGKTTTLRIIAGFLAADGGKAIVDGIDVAADPLAAQRRLGYLAEGAPAYDDMRVEDYLRYRARLKGAASGRVAAALDAARALDVARRRIGHLSKGYRQRVGLADALVADPPILVLDEPTAGLDPSQIREVRDLVRELARERTVLLSTHILSEVEALAARVVVLRAGRVVAEGALDEIRQASRGTRAVVAAADEAVARQALDGRVLGPGVISTTLPAAEAARRLVAAGVAIQEIGPETRSLEDAFLGLTS